MATELAEEKRVEQKPIRKSGRPRVVIIGGGFAGLNAAKSLKNAAVDVVLIDRRNFHLFQPLLYQVATGGLSPGEITAPLRHVLMNQRNAEVLMAEVSGIDPQNRKVLLSNSVLWGGEIEYDYLIVAAGAITSYYGKDQWSKVAPGLKTIEDATYLRSRILTAFEAAERESDPEKRRAWLTFIVIGGGPTGVEMAGALGEIANDTLKNDFRHINPAESSVMLFEGSGRVLSSFHHDLSVAAERDLIRLGVRVRPGLATAIDGDSVVVKHEGKETRFAAKTIIWAAGVQASPLGRVLNEATGVEVDKSGRVIVENNFSIPGHPEIFVIGDLANFSHQGGMPLPGVAQPAIQAGKYVAKLIQAREKDEKIDDFHYNDLGSMATIGRNRAIAEVGKLRLHGVIAWLMWLFVHLMYIVGFSNRLIVFLRWTYGYTTQNRGARLITQNRE